MYDLELRGHHNMDTGELRRILSQISVHNTICRASIIALPNLDMESMGTVEVQVLHMAATRVFLCDIYGKHGRTTISVCYAKGTWRRHTTCFFNAPTLT